MIKFKDIKPDVIYELTLDDDQWDGLVFKLINFEDPNYNIDIIKTGPKYNSHFIQLGEAPVGHLSMLAIDSTLEIIAIRETHPEYWL